MKFTPLHFILLCATQSTVKSKDKMIDCYLCDDYKGSTCNTAKDGITHNATHDIVTDSHGTKNTMVSTPCKGQKSKIVKCRGGCLIKYQANCGCKKRYYV